MIGDRHGHLVDLERRGLMCACRGCYLLFTPGGAGGARFRAVPDRYEVFDDVRLVAGAVGGLQIPVSVAFFFVNSVLGQVAAFYPSPAGATESLLPLDTWAEVMADNPELATLTPDVEALLVRVDPATRAGSASSCRSTPATSSSGSCVGCGRASTGAPRRARRSRSSSTGVRARAVQR